MSNTNALHFYKYSGCGNDFIIIDCRSVAPPTGFDSIVPQMCDRHYGIGADGLIVLLRGIGRADLCVEIYNADGSPAELCGNGLRCVIRCMHQDLGLIKDSYQITAQSGTYAAQIIGSDIEVMLGESSQLQGPWRCEIAPEYPMYFLHVGVPHAVLICPDIAGIDVQRIGRAVRHHPLFSHDGANVNFIQWDPPHRLMIRTYERGVEAETLACGTGGAASSIVASLHFKAAPPFHVITKGGRVLRYFFDAFDAKAKNISMRGEAEKCFSGFYQIPQTPVTPPVNSLNLCEEHQQFASSQQYN